MHWRISGPEGKEPDVEPEEGLAVIEGDKRTGEVEFDILPDDVPELDEKFTLHLTRVESGGEVDTTFNTAEFVIRSVIIIVLYTIKSWDEYVYSNVYHITFTSL